VEPDEAGVDDVAAPCEQARGLHPRRHLDDRRGRDSEALGELAGREAVGLRQGGEEEVLAEPYAVAAEGGVGRSAHQLRRAREEGDELAHRRSLS
jgi:hypothetical protein